LRGVARHAPSDLGDLDFDFDFDFDFDLGE
jgi:hypothetical protein